MTPEIIYLGHDNPINKILKADGVAQDLGSVTRMTLTIGSTLIDSDSGAGDPILWNQEGYATGEVRFSLGAQAITPGRYAAWLVVYDPTNTEGVVWGSFPVYVVAEVEGEAPV